MTVFDALICGCISRIMGVVFLINEFSVLVFGLCECG